MRSSEKSRLVFKKYVVSSNRLCFSSCMETQQGASRLNKLKTIQQIRNGNYFLFTFANPYYTPSVKVESIDELEALLLTRLDAIHPELADSVIVTPCQGCYEGNTEPSVMVTIHPVALLQNFSAINAMMRELCHDLGQDSFILKNAYNFMTCSKTGQTKGQGKGLTILDDEHKDNYTIVNGVKFTLHFTEWN